MEENTNMIYVPLELFINLSAKAEQIAVIERLTWENGYMSVSDLRSIIAARPIPDENKEAELNFEEMLKDVPIMEEMTCT